MNISPPPRIDKLFYKSQRDWIQDDSPLKILVKSRQTGFTWCNSYRLVILVSAEDARLSSTIGRIPALSRQRRLNYSLTQCPNPSGKIFSPTERVG